MKITLTCTFPSGQSAFEAANLLKESGYDIEKVSVFQNKNAPFDLYRKAYLPFAQQSYETDFLNGDINYPASHISSVAAVLGFRNIVNPFNEDLPKEFSEYLNEGAYMQCLISSHQKDAAEKIFSEFGGDNFRAHIPS